MRSFLRIHSVLDHSEANGPGVRSVVWFQGCRIRCSGCWNPDTHQSDGGELASLAELAKNLSSIDSDGVTFTGGEPMDQLDGCLELAERLQRAGKSVVMFTGYGVGELPKMVPIDTLRACFDTILAGPYNFALGDSRELSLLRDKAIWHLSGRYTDSDFLTLPEVEVVVTNRDTVITGLGLPTRRKNRDFFKSL